MSTIVEIRRPLAYWGEAGRASPGIELAHRAVVSIATVHLLEEAAHGLPVTSLNHLNAIQATLEAAGIEILGRRRARRPATPEERQMRHRPILTAKKMGAFRWGHAQGPANGGDA